MHQLTLFEPDLHVSVRIVPQPIKDGGDWQWPYSRSSAVVCTNPTTSTGMLTHSPYQVGAFYNAKVIENVRVGYTQSRGWVWVLKLREAADTDFEAWWSLLKSVERPPELKCVYCGDVETVLMVNAMTAYHVEPGEPDLNAPLLLCKDCREDYVSYWTERWKEYYGNL